MKLNKSRFATAVTCVAGLWLASANAATTLKIWDGVTLVVDISDNGGYDQDPTVGSVQYDGAIGNWTVLLDLGTTKPVIGGVLQPEMDLSFSAVSKAAGTLTVTFSDDGFGPMPAAPYQPLFTIGGTTKGSVSYSAIVAGEGPFSGGTFVSNGSITAFSDQVQGPLLTLPVAQTFGMSQTLVITHGNGSGIITTGDAHLAVVPEPSTCVAGALLLLPFAASTTRFLRRKRS